MKQVLLGFLAAVLMLALGALAASGVAALRWKHWVEAEGWYLKEPAVQLTNGKVLTRKEILDLLIAERLKTPR